MTTSTFTGALDAAFLPRADFAIEVPAPDAEGAPAILSTALRDMAAAFPALLEYLDHFCRSGCCAGAA